MIRRRLSIWMVFALPLSCLAISASVAVGRQVDGNLGGEIAELHEAAYREDVAAARELVRQGVNVNAANRYGVTALALACLSGNIDMVELLLDAGADVQKKPQSGESLLLIAARVGKPEPVRALLRHGADVDAKDRKGQTAIMWAAAEGHLQAVDVLIEAGSDFESPLASGFTPLFFAVRQGHTSVALRLLDSGVDINEVMQPERKAAKGPQAGVSPLLMAVENGHFELAVALLNAGADPNDDRAGYTALHAIVSVRKPIRGDGDPPPIGSGAMDSLEFVRQLVNHGAMVDALHPKQNSAGARLNRTAATPFLLASETGDLPLMRLLLKLGANPLVENVDQCTPLLAAAGVGVLGDGDESAGTEEEAIAAVKLLLERGCDINATDLQGNTAMHGAAYKSWTHLIQFLADNGADPDIWNRRNRRGWTPMMIAEGNRPGNFRPSQETIEALKRITPDFR
jgi:uncharacterized protein